MSRADFYTLGALAAGVTPGLLYGYLLGLPAIILVFAPLGAGLGLCAIGRWLVRP